MIASIFAKSKPVNFIITVLYIIIMKIGHSFFNYNSSGFEFNLILFSPVIVITYVFVLDFIISKNELTKRHSYAIMTFAFLVAIFPEIFKNSNFLIANLLLILCMRRLFSLHTKKNLNNKIFDAVFLIAMASLFYTWCALFLIVVILALAFYWQNEGKYIAIFFVALLSVFVLTLIFNILVKDAYLLESNFSINYSLDFSVYNNFSDIISLTLVASLYIWSVFYYLSNKDKNKTLQPIRTLVLLTSIIAVFVVMLAPEKKGEEFVFILLPFAIIFAKYIEIIKDKWFKEMFITLMFLVPLIKLLL